LSGRSVSGLLCRKSFRGNSRSFGFNRSLSSCCFSSLPCGQFVGGRLGF